jgi:hypothetical protein
MLTHGPMRIRRTVAAMFTLAGICLVVSACAPGEPDIPLLSERASTDDALPAVVLAEVQKVDPESARSIPGLAGPRAWVAKTIDGVERCVIAYEDDERWSYGCAATGDQLTVGLGGVSVDVDPTGHCEGRRIVVEMICAS